MRETTQTRIAWLDRMKGILILLVVAGHIVGGGSHLASGLPKTMLEACYRLIYMFHMPAFFFVAGLLWRDSDNFLRFMKKRAYRLLVPYFIFGLLSIMLYSVTVQTVLPSMHATGSTHYGRFMQTGVIDMLIALLYGGGWPNDGFRCNSVLWFLPCMFTTLCVYYWYVKLIRPKWLRIVTLPFIIATDCFIRQHLNTTSWPMGLGRLFEFLPFVIVGNMIAPWLFKALGELHEWQKQLLGVGTLATYLVIGLVFSKLWPIFGHDFLCRYLFLVIAAIGMAMIICAANLMRWGFLEKFGAYSMGVMLMHKPFVVFLQYKVPAIKSLYSHGGCFTALVVSLILSFLISILCLGFAMVLNKKAPWMLGNSSREK